MTISLHEQNRRLLRQYHPALGQRLNDCAPQNHFRYINTPSGFPTLLSLRPGHESQFLHSPEDPLAEARELLKGYRFSSGDLTVLMGMGLGYLPLAILERMAAEHHLLIVEASPAILVKACERVDLTALLSDSRVSLFTADQIPEIRETVMAEQFRVLGGSVQQLIYPPARDLDPRRYAMVEQEITAVMASLQTNLATLEGQWELLIGNVVGNMPAVGRAAAIDCLAGAARGGAALIVAAGPSLDKNIAHIRNAKGKLLIIAVDAALKALLAEGIQPDLIVAVEPLKANLMKVSGIDVAILAEIPLLFCPTVYHEVPRRFGRAKFVVGSPHGFVRWALGLGGAVMTVPSGFSGAHYAFHLAAKMGVAEIVFAGLDLAFSADHDHARNCARTWVRRTDREYPHVPDVFGNMVPTDEGFQHMIMLFEHEIAKSAITCIDATEGGALIRGTRVMTLKDALKRSQRGPSPVSAVWLQQQWQRHSRPRADAVSQGLEWLLDEARTIEPDCNRALALLRPFVSESILTENDRTDGGATQDGRVRSWQNVAGEVNRLATRVARHERFGEVVKDLMSQVLVNQYRANYRLQQIHDAATIQNIETEKSFLYFHRLAGIAHLIQQSAQQSKQLSAPEAAGAEGSGHDRGD